MVLLIIVITLGAQDVPPPPLMQQCLHCKELLESQSSKNNRVLHETGNDRYRHKMQAMISTVARKHGCECLMEELTTEVNRLPP